MKIPEKVYLMSLQNTQDLKDGSTFFVTDFLVPVINLLISKMYKGKIINKAHLAELKAAAKVFKTLDKKIIELQKEYIKAYREAVTESKKSLSCEYICQIKALQELKKSVEKHLEFMKEMKREYLKYIYSSIKNFINHYDGFDRLDLDEKKTSQLYYGGENDIL